MVTRSRVGEDMRRAGRVKEEPPMVDGNVGEVVAGPM